MTTLDMRDRITLGAGALLIIGVALLLIAVLTAQFPLAVAGVGSAVLGRGVLSRQRRSVRR